MNGIEAARSVLARGQRRKGPKDWEKISAWVVGAFVAVFIGLMIAWVGAW